MNSNWREEQWKSLQKNKLAELKRQKQKLETLQNLQIKQIFITKTIRKRIKREIFELQLQVDEERTETTASISTPD